MLTHNAKTVTGETVALSYVEGTATITAVFESRREVRDLAFPSASVAAAAWVDMILATI